MLLSVVGKEKLDPAMQQCKKDTSQVTLLASSIQWCESFKILFINFCSLGEEGSYQSLVTSYSSKVDCWLLWSLYQSPSHSHRCHVPAGGQATNVLESIERGAGERHLKGKGIGRIPKLRLREVGTRRARAKRQNEKEHHEQEETGDKRRSKEEKATSKTRRNP